MSDLQAKARLPPHGDRSTDEPLSLRHAVAPAHFQKLVDLEVEILRIRKWLARQTQSSADAERLEQALNRLETAYYNRRHPPRTEAERLDHVLTEQGAPSPGTTGARRKSRSRRAWPGRRAEIRRRRKRRFANWSNSRASRPSCNASTANFALLDKSVI